VVLVQLGQEVLDVRGTDVDDRRPGHQQLAKQLAEVLAAQLIDVQAKIGRTFVGGLDGDDFDIRNPWGQQVAGGYGFANGSGKIQHGNSHENSCSCGRGSGRRVAWPGPGEGGRKSG